ncbi:hypothetical protein [Galactobacter valiniphilus]|uniref:hypothetical protein n=1 Tax=Galactobacter valiniphilus TaxID=2676122 RepID=UPI003736AAF5
MSENAAQDEPRYGQRLPSEQALRENPATAMLEDFIAKENAKDEAFRPKAPAFAAAWLFLAFFTLLGGAIFFPQLGGLWLAGMAGVALGALMTAWLTLAAYWDTINLKALRVVQVTSKVLYLISPPLLMIAIIRGL